jgi:heme iron utilization protein
MQIGQRRSARGGEIEAKPLMRRTGVHAGLNATEATMTAVDRLGFHLKLKTYDGMKGTRINFLREVQNSDEARKVLVEMVRAAEPKA